ncbi:metabotropic glutamate receptor 7-like [Nelusetta ayraudi]|uniref:metabotropic glutamate receptor 7-like n=1 Tax=Nelusetta ayraudi TaxID=303726 RepID=UPI003F72F018
MRGSPAPLLLLLLAAAAHETPAPPHSIRLEGDVTLGGLFPVHARGPAGAPCGELRRASGVQRLEAMMFALDVINGDRALLPNITLGARVLDTCSRDTRALEQSLAFVRSPAHWDASDARCADGAPPLVEAWERVTGVVGASTSSESVLVATILRLFQIPQVSYGSTAAELSDERRYDFFSRVVAADTSQAEAMVALLQALQWRYVSTVASQGHRGPAHAFLQRSREAGGICIAQSLKVPADPGPAHFDKIIRLLLDTRQARTVVLFASQQDIRGLLSASQRAQQGGHFLWVGSNSWGAHSAPLLQLEDAALGAITVLPRRAAVSAFDWYFTSRTLENNRRNVWFAEFWEETFNCSLTASSRGQHSRKCTGQERIGVDSSYQQEATVHLVMDAVLTFAHALHNMQRDLCPLNDGLCPDMELAGGRKLLRYIRNVSFNGSGGTWVSFNRKGDAPGRYDLLQYQCNNQSGRGYRRIGQWAESLQLNAEELWWPGGGGRGQATPLSVCSLPCGAGQRKVLVHGAPCCWRCEACGGVAYLADAFTCRRCARHTHPAPDRRSCQPIPVERPDWTSPWALGPALLAAAGTAASGLTLAGLLRKARGGGADPAVGGDDPAVGGALGYLLLGGVLLSFVTAFPLLATPTPAVCGLRRLLLGLGPAVSHASLLAETLRLRRGQRSAGSEVGLLGAAGALISAQLLGALLWLAVEPPAALVDYEERATFDPRLARGLLRCDGGDLRPMMSLAPGLLLVVAGAVLAVGTRPLPDPSPAPPQAKVIGVATFTSCVVWTAFVPAFFSTASSKDKLHLQTASLTVWLSLSGWLLLWLLFLPSRWRCCRPLSRLGQQGGAAADGPARTQQSQQHSEWQPDSQSQRCAPPEELTAADVSIDCRSGSQSEDELATRRCVTMTTTCGCGSATLLVMVGNDA